MKLLNGSYGLTAANAVGYDADNSTVIDGTNDTFSIDVNGTGAVVVTLDAGTYTGTELATELQSKVKSALLAGSAAQVAHADNVTVVSERAGAGATFEIEVSGLADTETFVLAENGGDTFLADTNVGAVTAATGDGGVFQVGANNTADDQISVSIVSVSASDLGLAPLDLSSDAGAALATIDLAIASVSASRGDLGAVQNRFESTIANLQVTSENLAASESRIRDTDVAEQMVEFTRAQILQQAGTAMLGQANAVPQSVLRLLG